jgi:enoyl-CoA hydratase/carnithine racemase
LPPIPTRIGARKDRDGHDHRLHRAAGPARLKELAQLGRTLHRRRADMLAYFDHHASNGPTEAINELLEALRRNALGFSSPITHPPNQCTLKPEEPAKSPEILTDPGNSLTRNAALSF